MSWQQPELMSSNQHHLPDDLYHHCPVQKPVEIYLFLDPFSETCWALQFYLKKLMLEYGRFFTIRAIISSRFSLIQKQNNENVPVSDRTAECCQTMNPLNTSLAIKASELQGKRAGKAFLRRLQEKLFIDDLDISRPEVLVACAEEANLDVAEFEKDMTSPSAKRAYQCDLRLTNEMAVETLPTLVFFNQSVEEQGIKVSGLYSYEIYELVLSEILQYVPIPSAKPPLEELVKNSSIIGTEEIAIIYDWSETKALREMKKLQLRQLVEIVQRNNGMYWKPKFL